MNQCPVELLAQLSCSPLMNFCVELVVVVVVVVLFIRMSLQLLTGRLSSFVDFCFFE